MNVDAPTTVSDTPPPVDEASSGARPGILDRIQAEFRTTRPAVVVGYLVALVPVYWVLRRVHESPQMPFQDYWSALSRFTNPDGSIHLRGFFSYQNEHPFLVPNILYYLDAKFLEGTNHVLGYFSVGVAILIILALRQLLPPTWNEVARAWMTAAASLIVLSPTGLWNFVRGMSGAAWLTANIFALVAIMLALRGRTILAVIAAAISILSYGTGFGAPVAIIVIAVLLRQARWRWLLPAGLLVGALIVYKATSNGGTTGTSPSHDPVLLSSTFLSNLGLLWDSSGGPIAIVSGAIGLAVLLGGFWTACRRDDLPDLIAWWGVGAYSICASGLISIGRSEVFEGNGAQGRYTSLSALFWVAALVVAVRLVLLAQPRVVQVGVVAVTSVCFIASSNALATVATAQNSIQNVQAAAVAIGYPQAYDSRMYMAVAQIKRLKGLGDYPFVSSYKIGCGRKLGDTIDAKAVRTLTVPSGGNLGAIDSDGLTTGSRHFVGWLHRAAAPTECVLVIDQTGKIIGGGAVGENRLDVSRAYPSAGATSGFEAVSPPDIAGQRLVFGFSDGFYELRKA